MREWYAIQTKPRREFFADSALASVEGVQTYLPCLHVKPVNPRSRKTRAFFPGYLFAYADLEQTGPSILQHAPGVARVVGCGDLPAVIPSSAIEEIRMRVAQVQREDPSGLGRFRRGDRVHITAGPLAGFEGMFDTCLSGQLRARLLVEFLGRWTVTELDVRYLEEVPSHLA